MKNVSCGLFRYCMNYLLNDLMLLIYDCVKKISEVQSRIYYFVPDALFASLGSQNNNFRRHEQNLPFLQAWDQLVCASNALLICVSSPVRDAGTA